MGLRKVISEWEGGKMKEKIKSLLSENEITGVETMCQATGLTDTKLRETVLDMILSDHDLIGSCEQGYYLIQTYEELQDTIRFLKSPFRAIYQRCTALEFNWDIKHTTQRSFL